ncbi:MAG: hypothetical protein DMF56_01205 [Acidobacteria bacterium]|nr:MAG: hypothetical protein DMF56_01205 [Acidobacteriota bacterium]
MNDLIELNALRALCDVLDEYPDTLRLILPHDYARVADLVGADVKSASVLIVVTADDHHALRRLLATITAAGLQYQSIDIRNVRESLRLLVRSERSAQLLIRIGAPGNVERKAAQRFAFRFTG